MMSEKRYFTNHGYYINDSFHDGRKWLVNVVDAQEIVDELNNLDMKARERSKALSKLQKKYDEQQELIEELQVSDEMGWKRAEHFEKKCPKELHNKKMYIKRLEYKVQKFKEENEQLKQQLLYDGDDVCGICKYEYLIPSHNYFISKCEKGHEECSKEDIQYCEDFKVKELNDE